MTDQTQPEASPKFDLFAQVAADAAANGSAEIVADAEKYLRGLQMHGLRFEGAASALLAKVPGLDDVTRARVIDDVYAVGDVANWLDGEGNPKRVEHWNHVVEQASVVAATITGGESVRGRCPTSGAISTTSRSRYSANRAPTTTYTSSMTTARSSSPTTAETGS